MRAYDLTDETIVVDRDPCGLEEPAEWTCHGRLAEFLPPGAQLTVLTQDGARYTYTGAPV